jgi:BNR repeat-like domain
MDDGVTRTQARPLDLPTAKSGIDAVALSDGRVVLAYNHTAQGRSPLNLAFSTNGEHFRMFHTLESDPASTLIQP